MATNLKKTDVVVVGLGAVGGVAVAAAGAGGPRGDRPGSGRLAHGARLRAGRAAQQFPRLAAVGAESEHGDSDAPAERLGAVYAALSDPPDDERGRRHLGALLGAELAPQSVGLQGRERDDAALRRRPAYPKGSTVEDWPFGLEELEPYYDKVEYEVGVSGKAGNIDGKIDPRGNIFEGPRAARISDAAAARHGIHRRDGGARAQEPRLAARFPARPRSIRRPTTAGPGCVYHGYCNRGGCHVNAKNSTAASTIPKAQDTGRSQGRHAGARHDDRGRRRAAGA